MTSITLDVDKALGNGLWLVELEEEAKSLITGDKGISGGRTILAVRNYSVGKDGLNITTPLTNLTTLVRGSGPECLVVDVASGETDEVGTIGWKIQPPIQLRSNDQALIDLCQRTLAPSLSAAAKEVVGLVRKLDSEGHFQEADRGKFVNRQNNFVTLRVQPRKGDILVTIYGNPDLYEDMEELTSSTLEMKRDQNGYTRFNWSRPDELEVVKALLEGAYNNKKRRANRGWLT